MREELRVKLENGAPRFFWRRGRRHAVLQVLERWRDTGRWWEGEAPKLFFRLETAGGGLWEIYLDTAEDRWYLYKMYD